MSLLYRRDADPAEFVRPAQRFLSAVRMGQSDEEAAARAKTTLGEVKLWMRQPGFHAAYRDARRRKVKAQCFNMAELLQRDRRRRQLTDKNAV